MKLKQGSIPLLLWGFLRSQLSLARFDLFLQGTLLILTLYDGYAYLLLRRSVAAGLLTPRTEEWVYIGAAVAEFLLGAILAWAGRNIRHFALSGWLLMTSIAGLLVLVFPQPGVDEAVVELCGGSLITQTLGLRTETLQLPASTTLVIITAVLCALSRVSVWAHGITYLDDHEPQNGAYVYGILISIRISVGVNARSWFETHAQGENWWKGQLSFAMLTLMFSILFALFPKKMSSWKPFTEEEKAGTGFLETVSRLLRNKMLMIQTVALALINAGVWGFVHHEREFVQTRYQIESAAGWSDGRTSRLTGDILRTFVIVFFVAIFRARFSGRRPDGVKATTAAKVGGVVGLLAAAFFLVLALLKCDAGDIAGLTEGGYEQPGCSGQCGCNSESYTFAPVCALDTLTTYFSPCHAGCSSLEDLNGFYIFDSCTCGGAGAAGRAVRGSCAIRDCSTLFTVYQIIYVNALALSAASILMQGMVLLRSVRRTDKPVSIGLAFGIIALIAHVPGHLLYMFLSDTNCAYESSSQCLLHHASFPPMVAGVSAGLVFLSALVSLVSFLIGKSSKTNKELQSF